MSTPAKIAIGVFATLIVLCQLGMFDASFNIYFERRMLADRDWLTRTLYPLVRSPNLTAELRDEYALGFLAFAAIPSIGITSVFYVFLMGLRAIAKGVSNSAGHNDYVDSAGNR